MLVRVSPLGTRGLGCHHSVMEASTDRRLARGVWSRTLVPGSRPW